MDVVENFVSRRAVLRHAAAWSAATALPVQVVAAPTAVAPIPGGTRIARWKDDRTAAFLLMFDDSLLSHWQVAAPELFKRSMIATFYINPGKAEYQKFAARWEDELWKQGMVYGNHTMTHQGFADLEGAEREIGGCADIIRRIVPGPERRLLSFGKPGLPPGRWNISAQDFAALLRRHDLIDRPTFDKHGAVYHWQTTEQMLALADRAIAAQGMEYLIIHGVERIGPNVTWQDFWALKQDVFLPLLDGLQQRQAQHQLWITDHISQHQYQTERDSAELSVRSAADGALHIELTCRADPVLYRLPLTLLSTVPSTWREALVTQGERQTRAVVVDRMIRYDAIPGDGPIVVRPVG
ncbi:MAG: hypothetical protein CFE40_09450 [Burkholderiales bacterium PBB1]|nr:MAG: hypothetical protein CFE40_09450 [Burkholderiales bacterium PBB1]